MDQLSRVLVVCDDLGRGDLMLGTLLAVGVDAVPAYSVGEAVGALDAEPIDAVVVDDDLEEGLTGLLRWLRAKYRGVVVFADADDERGRDALAPGGLDGVGAVTSQVLAGLQERRRRLGTAQADRLFGAQDGRV